MDSDQKSLSYWVITRNFHPVWAGPSERFFRYAKISKPIGLAIEFKTIEKEGLESKGDIDGVLFERMNARTLRQLHWLVLERALFSKSDRPNGLVFLDPGWESILINPVLRSLGLKTVFVSTMEFQIDRRANGELRKGLHRILFKFWYKRLMKSFDFIVSSTAFLSQRYQELGVPVSHLKIIHNGIDINRFKPCDELSEKEKIRERLSIPRDGFIFLFVGLMNERKGVLELLEGWKRYKKNLGTGHLVLVGNEKRSQEEAKFFSLFDAWRPELEQKYQVISHPASPEIQLYYQAADAFVFLSKLEGMPNVLWEAMACGLPILLHKFSGFSQDYGTEGKHFLATGLGEVEVAKKLEKIGARGTEVRHLGSNGLELASKHSNTRSIQAFKQLLQHNQNRFPEPSDET